MLGRILFYPTLLSNVIINRLGLREWYTKIDDNVILGALPFRSMTEELKEQGVTGVITMNEKYETEWFCNSTEEWNTAGIEHLCLETEDFIASPTLSKIQKGVHFIEGHRMQQGRVYVHCKAGRTRSTTLVACYLMKVYKWTEDEAVEHIKKKRSHIVLRKKQWDSLKEYRKLLQTNS